MLYNNSLSVSSPKAYMQLLYVATKPVVRNLVVSYNSWCLQQYWSGPYRPSAITLLMLNMQRNMTKDITSKIHEYFFLYIVSVTLQCLYITEERVCVCVCVRACACACACVCVCVCVCRGKVKKLVGGRCAVSHSVSGNRTTAVMLVRCNNKTLSR
jgi:hypothetical protein